jgi:hypothetical protein
MTLSALFTPRAAISIKSGEQLKIDTVLLVLLTTTPHLLIPPFPLNFKLHKPFE